MELKKRRQYDAMARERNQQPQEQTRHKTQPTLISYARAARFNQDQDDRRAAARRRTPRTPKQRGSNQNQSPREKPFKDETEERAPI
jgi:hypothetical protein